MSSERERQDASEETPLLSRADDEEQANYTHANGNASPAAQSLRSHSDGKRQRRWPSAIALTFLSLAVVAVLGLGFAGPAVVEEYTKQALVFEPTDLSIESFTVTGVRARIQGTFWLDGSRVEKKPVRDLGRVGTWIAREVESGESELKVYLPEYGNVLLGTAKVPAVKVNVRDGYYNHIDFYMDLEPGDVEGIRRIAHDWLDGRLGSLSVRGIARVPLRSGILKLGSQVITQDMRFDSKAIPALPPFNVEKLKIDEYGPPGKLEGMKAVARISLLNDYPVKFDIPSLAFDILVPDCFEDYLMLAEARTDITHVLPKQNVSVSVTAFVRQLPASLTTACPGSNSSPLDVILRDYLKGQKTTVFVKGGKQNPDTPDWIGKLMQDTTVPVPLPGHPFDNLMKNFSLANAHFGLPDPFAEPNTPEAQPKISATVKALVGLPKEMDFNVNVSEVRANPDVYYKGEKLGNLDLHKWQPARTTKVNDGLLIESDVGNIPLNVTDDDVLTDVIQAIMFGKGANLEIQTTVDAKTITALGDFVIREIPAKGRFFLKPIRGPGFEPQVSDLKILDSAPHTITLQATLNVTNPTEYSAHVPYVNVSVSSNSTDLGFAAARNVEVVPGANLLTVSAVLDIGREFLSQYVSGYNTTLTLRSHEGSIPSQPSLGNALSRLNFTIDTPKVFGKFIEDATMHVISSSATFILLSPVDLSITNIAAVAMYNGTEVGTIDYVYPFDIAAGASQTPRLPVKWALNNDVIRDALGGTLKLDAKADVGVKIGQWERQLWYVGSGIGAKIRI